MSKGEVKAVFPDRSKHDHRHGHARGSRQRLSIVLLLTTLVMIAELLGGLWTGSLALLADAAQNFRVLPSGDSGRSHQWRRARPDLVLYFLRSLSALVCAAGHSQCSHDYRGGRRPDRKPD